MKFQVIASIAKTHLLSRMKQTVIAALGVTFGIGTFITMVCFMTGLNGLLDGLILNRTPHVHLFNEIKPSSQQPVQQFYAGAVAEHVIHSVQPKKSQLRIHNALPILNQLNADQAVKGAIPQVMAQVFYQAGSIKLNGRVSGIVAEEESRLFSLSDYVVAGDLNDLSTVENGVLLGAGIARKMSVGIGDRVLVSSAEGNFFPLKIIGLYQSGLAEVDDVQSYTSLRTAQRILGKGGSYITDINVKLWDMEQAPEMAQTIRRKYNLNAIDIKAANAQFETGTSIRNIITYSVSIALLIVAGFGIYNILNMLIYEKMNDIAILKATGFSGQDVQKIFISQAMIIGLVGGLLGLLVGLGLSMLIDRTPFETDALPTISTFPVNFDPNFFLIGIVFALVSTFFAGYLPARKARKMDPVQVIRGQ